MANFRTSARSVDMLGRQQIAGIPTAVSEIFKNAYDAYATHVRGDFFPEKRVLMVRDDGVGMSQEDFKTRWLTVGTESKAPGSTLPQIERPNHVAPRRQMGEKGIGRLAIATTGPQLIIISRPHKPLSETDDEILFALVQWTLFEVPGLTLEDVAIPIRMLKNIEDADASVLESVRTEFQNKLSDLGDRVPDRFREQIEGELAHLTFDPRKYLNLSGPQLGQAAGTAFIVSPVSPDVDAVMEVRDSKPDEYSVSEFQRFLLGFTNTITPRLDSPEFSPEFIRHESSGYEDIIGSEAHFWDEDDFNNTDHNIEGSFDEYGTFTGVLSIYGAPSIEVVEPWAGGKGDRSSCGAFKIKFGYVQGQASESNLPADEFATMTRRLGKIGGLYVYRDGIRVLPYGNSDNDYLEIEKRRSLNAGTYYFSYRRMFGSIDLDSGTNSNLQEKAGREGFRENRAYRDFKNILQNFLIQLAANFFSNKSDSAEEWRLERDRLRSRSSGRLDRERKEKHARERFLQIVRDRINYIESGRLTEDISNCVKELAAEINSGGQDQLFTDLAELERKAISDLDRLRTHIDIVKPEELPLSRDEDRDWRSLSILTTGANELFSNAISEFDRLFEDARRISADVGTGQDGQTNRQARIHTLTSESRDEVAELAKEVESIAASLGTTVAVAVRDQVTSFNSLLTELTEKNGGMSIADESRLRDELRVVTVQQAAKFNSLLATSRSFADFEGIARENLALKEEVLDLKEQIEGNLELLQLGQAVQIVSHEFEASITSVRAGLKKLMPWAKSTPRLQPIVRDLRASFTHLDGYLRLFTPLQRRLYREAVVISGDEIESFLRGVFDERLRRHDVELKATDSFRMWALEGYPSTFYPSFVNIVDNAIHWVSWQPSGEKTVTLDADNNGVYIRDTGPGVRPRDHTAIFERGFGRRRGGRGLGLPLAKELLERDGWALEVLDNSSGAEFRIRKVEDDK